jgi:hypothetical protein
VFRVTVLRFCDDGLTHGITPGQALLQLRCTKRCAVIRSLDPEGPGFSRKRLHRSVGQCALTEIAGWQPLEEFLLVTRDKSHNCKGQSSDRKIPSQLLSS